MSLQFFSLKEPEDNVENVQGQEKKIDLAESYISQHKPIQSKKTQDILNEIQFGIEKKNKLDQSDITQIEDIVEHMKTEEIEQYERELLFYFYRYNQLFRKKCKLYYEPAANEIIPGKIIFKKTQRFINQNIYSFSKESKICYFLRLRLKELGKKYVFKGKIFEFFIDDGFKTDEVYQRLIDYMLVYKSYIKNKSSFFKNQNLSKLLEDKLNELRKKLIIEALMYNSPIKTEVLPSRNSYFQSRGGKSKSKSKFNSRRKLKSTQKRKTQKRKKRIT